ncbi:hypothetical protein BGX34_008412 [Mortierella sp. NVP85]|nr:hypothetical protein BGX34_008412 [Mortierella sp. NVP85]
MAFLRGSHRRTLAIILGLFLFVVLFSLTPSSDNDIDQQQFSWQSDWRSTSLTQEQKEALLSQKRDRERMRLTREKMMKEMQEMEDRREEELERLRLKEEENRDREVDEINHDRILFNKIKSPQQEEKQQVPLRMEPKDDSPADEVDMGSDDGELLKDTLPTEFNGALFPATSRIRLEDKIGTKALNEYLFGKPQSVQARDAAIAYILAQANIAYRSEEVYSVVIKPREKIPPSGDIHDYSSLARYFWKNPNTPDGLPYIRIDGKPNPDMDSVQDYRLLRRMFRDCYYMGQAYFWTGDERYAEKIVYRVKQWFLDDETRMNPNVKFASLIFGNNLGRAQGVLDMFKVYGLFDALKAIQESKALQAEPYLIPDLQRWFTKYLDWLNLSPQANQEKNARNNHGTYFTVQYVSILEFLGRNEEAREVMLDAKQKRIGSQIRKDGAQPHETARPISFFYSTFNLQGLMQLAIQADTHGVDLWHYKGPYEKPMVRVNSKVSYQIEVGGATIEDAIRYLAIYAVKDVSEWPYPDSGTRSVSDVLKMAKMAALVYGQDRWQELIDNLEAKLDDAFTNEEGDDEEKATSDGDPNSFICELSVLSKGQLWNCYK